MNEELHKLERFVDRAIPYIIIVLLITLILQFFFYDKFVSYLPVFDFINFVAFVFFVTDLSFKYNRVRNIPKFVKQNWLGIIAVFPFFMIFRIFEEIGLIANFWDDLSKAEMVFDEVRDVEKEAARIIRLSHKTHGVSRAVIISRYIKPLTRLPRLLNILSYYEKPILKKK